MGQLQKFFPEAKGKHNEKLAIAKRLKAIGMSVSEIVKATELSIDEVAAL